MDNKPIGIFDSGIGGLSIYSAIKKLLPKENFLYLADQINCPYGIKNRRDIRELACRNTRFLLKKKCKLIVVACNTVTTAAIDLLRKHFPRISFVGVVPVVKPAVQQSLTGHFIIFSTKATQKSQYLKKLIIDFARDKVVYNLSCEHLVSMIEKGEIKGRKINCLLKKCLKDGLKDKQVDTLAVGCTHYPFIREAIIGSFSHRIRFIEAGPAVARQVRKILKKKNIFSSEKCGDRFFTTANPCLFEKTFQKLIGFKIKAEKVKL